MLFTVQGQKHKFGSKLFPVASKNRIAIFNNENTVELDRNNPLIIELARQMDHFNYPMGYCYSNSYIIYKLAQDIGIEAAYYSGWLMYPELMPIHHAWVVINGNSVIDVGINIEEFNAMQRADRSNSFWKEKVAREIADIRKKEYAPSTYCVFGKVNTWNILVGSPDEPENAKRIFRDLTKKYPNHPSYAHKGQNMLGASELQKMIYKHL